MARRLLVELVRSMAVLILLLALVHVPPLNRMAGSFLVARAAASRGFEASADRVTFNLLTQGVTIEGLRVARRSAPGRPLCLADSARIRLGVSWRPPILHLRTLEVAHAWLDVGAESGGSAWLPFLLSIAGAERVIVRSLDVTGVAQGPSPGATSVGLRNLSIRFTAGAPGPLAGQIAGAGGSVVRAGDFAVSFNWLRLIVQIRPREVIVKSLRAQFPGGLLLAGGRMFARNDGPRIELEFDGRLDPLLPVTGWPFPWRAAEHPSATGQLVGAVSRPQLRVDVAPASF